MDQEVVSHQIYVIKELCQHNLQEELTQRRLTKKTFEKFDVLELIFNVVKTLAFLETQRVYHKPFVPSNFYRTFAGKIKITNFRLPGGQRKAEGPMDRARGREGDRGVRVRTPER